jgi:hypothetical protein
MLVLDGSGSMMAFWDHDGDSETAEVRRWNSLYHVVEFIVGGFDHTLEFGAQMFPQVGSGLGNDYVDACNMGLVPEVSIAADNGDAILAGIPGPEAILGGGTPATVGIQNSVTALTQLDGFGPRAIILVTDGAANCKAGEEGHASIAIYDDNLPGVVSDTANVLGIPVYVVGIDIEDTMLETPAANPYEKLTEVAQAGGVPKPGDEPFYNVGNEIELEDTLETISDYIECTIELPEAPMFPEFVAVSMGGEELAQVDDCQSEDGWTYAGADSITMCGSACQAAETITVDYGCE